jgi:hypothetical protein
MGKGSEIERRFQERMDAIANGERAHPHPGRPEVRLRADTPAIDVTDETLVREAVGKISSGDYGVALRDHGTGEVKAMLVPVERYVEMASATMEGDAHFEWTGRELVPQRAALDALHIEQSNSQAPWPASSRSSVPLRPPSD